MKRYGHIPFVLLFMVIFSGCATTVRNAPVSIDIPGEFKKNAAITVLISEIDLKREESVSFGLIGFLFPLKVEVGEMLKSSAANCFNKLFNEVSIATSGAGNIVSLKIEEFSLSALRGKAHFKLMMTIKNEAGGTIMENNYSADGSGHAPIYWSDADQMDQISKTTQEAFQAVFSQIATDVKAIKFN